MQAGVAGWPDTSLLPLSYCHTHCLVPGMWLHLMAAVMQGAWAGTGGVEGTELSGPSLTEPYGPSASPLNPHQTPMCRGPGPAQPPGTPSLLLCLGSHHPIKPMGDWDCLSHGGCWSTPSPSAKPQHFLHAVETPLLLLTAVEVYWGPSGAPWGSMDKV